MNPLKLNSSKRRGIKYCPCGKSNSDGKFVPFDGYTEFGFCHSCDKVYRPSDGTISSLPPPVDLSPFIYSDNLVSGSLGHYPNNNLAKFLLGRFTQSQVKKTLKAYKVGTSRYWPGATVFWQIDKKNRARHGKIMLYDPSNGKRSKSHFNTVKNVLKIEDDNTILIQCLFGLHLASDNPRNKVALVESEKTALIMHILYPDLIWLATGGKNNFSYKMLKAVKSSEILAFPDKDAISEWAKVAHDLNKHSFNIRVNETLSDFDLGNNTDIADIFLALPQHEEIMSSRQINFNGAPTKIEADLLRLEQINPCLRSLITAFKLEL